MTSTVVALFALFNIVGGVIGYVKAKSVPSLVAGLVSGILLLVCVPGIRQGSPSASIVAIVISLLLGGRFLGTWRKNHRLMPDLIVVIFSVVTIVFVVIQLL